MSDFEFCHDSSTCDEGWSCIDDYCRENMLEDADAEEVGMIFAWIVGGGLILALLAGCILGSVMLCCRHRIPKGMPGHDTRERQEVQARTEQEACDHDSRLTEVGSLAPPHSAKLTKIRAEIAAVMSRESTV